MYAQSSLRVPDRDGVLCNSGCAVDGPEERRSLGMRSFGAVTLLHDGPMHRVRPWVRLDLRIGCQFRHWHPYDIARRWPKFRGVCILWDSGPALYQHATKQQAMLAATAGRQGASHTFFQRRQSHLLYTPMCAMYYLLYASCCPFEQCATMRRSFWRPPTGSRCWRWGLWLRDSTLGSPPSRARTNCASGPPVHWRPLGTRPLRPQPRCAGIP